MSNGGSFRGIKWTELEANHSPHHMPRLMTAAVFLLLKRTSWIAQGHVYLYLPLFTFQQPELILLHSENTLNSTDQLEAPGPRFVYTFI